MKTKDIETMAINQELLNLIAPQGIEIKSSRVQMGEFLSKIQYISGYPSRVNVGWLLNLKRYSKYNSKSCYNTNRRRTSIC